jgi:signal transduction histidine kinase
MTSGTGRPAAAQAVRGWLLDAWLWLPFLVFGLLGTAPAGHNQADVSRAPDLAAYALVVVAALALGLRRRPGPSLAVNGAAVALYLAAGYPYGPILFTAPAVVFTVAAQWSVRRAAPSVGGYLGVILSAALIKEWRLPTGAQGTEMLWLALAWSAVVAAALAVGTAVRVRREAAAGVRAEQARRAASEERLRMAQELHDTVGHGLAVIAMQAGVALHVLDRDPARARESMEAVRATSRESLDSLRAELDALRGNESVGARRPAPGLEDVERLAERVRAGGVAVRVEIDPDLPPLPPAVDAAAYRILQESMTNVLRHAGAPTAHIRVRGEGGSLRLEVTDSGRSATVDGTRPGRAAGAGTAQGARSGTVDGAGTASGSVTTDNSGTGIRGMRAQAEALGGTLDAGPCATGGFAVTAWLPLPGPTDPAGR